MIHVIIAMFTYLLQTSRLTNEAVQEMPPSGAGSAAGSSASGPLAARASD